MKKSFAETLKEPPTFSRDIYYRDSKFASLFSWVPWAAHKSLVFSSPAVLGGVYLAGGPIAAGVVSAGAAAYLYETLLFPRNINDFFIPRKQRMIKKDGMQLKKSKSVLVIGAGPSGLVTVKELKEAGHAVKCYDMNGSVGGTFYAHFWPKGMLVSSPYVTCFGDYEPKRMKDGKEHWKHHTAIEYVQYLRDYAENFDLMKDIHLKHKVQHLKQDDDGKYWITVQNLDDPKDEGKMEGPFDHVAMCSGPFNVKKIPKIPGLETYTGKLKHTSEFAALPGTTVEEAFKDLAGKRIVALGLGESLADILDIVTLRTSTPAKYAAVSVRQGANVFQRVHAVTGHIVDMATTRIRHGVPKALRSWVHMLMVNLKATFAVRLPFRIRVQTYMVNSLKRQSPTYCKSTKSDNFVRAVEAGKLDIKGPIARIDKDRVIFTDGSVIEGVDVLIMGTGFSEAKFNFIDENTFKMKDDEMTSMIAKEQRMQNEADKMLMTKCDGDSCEMSCGSPIALCPTTRYLRMFDPKIGDSLAFIGLGCRPLLGAIPPIAELQARLFAQVCSGTRELPTQANMMRRIRKDRIRDEYEFSRDNDSWQGLVNFIPFRDMLAEEIGCLPSRHWIFTRPKLASGMIFCGPLNHIYRLRGPGACKEAEEVLLKAPVQVVKGDNMMMMGTQFTVAMFYWPNTVLRIGRDIIDRIVNIF